MIVQEITSLDEKQIWARKGSSLVRKFRCTGGKKHGRIVPSPTACFTPIDIKKRAKMKITRARLGAKMARKSRKTKRTNPASIRLKSLNKR